MLKRIWARGISFCLISAEKRQVSQKKISDESSEPAPLSTVVIPFHPSFILRSAHRTNQSFFHWFLYGVYYDRPSCIFSNGATHPGIELALSSAARSGSGYYLENPYLNENHSHLAPYNTFLSKCQGFFWPFLPSFFGYFSWHFMLNLSY